MKTMEMYKNYSENIYSLSCLENYFIYILKKENYDFEYLFYDSFFPFSQILEDFSNLNMKYASYTSIPRLYDLARYAGLIKMEIFQGSNFTGFMNLFDYCFIKVKPQAYYQKYETQLWRSDHYIFLMHGTNENFYYINDLPRDEGYINSLEIREMYDNEVIGFNIIKCITLEIKNKFWEKFYSRYPLVNNQIELVNIDLEKLRDAIGILKVIRRRLKEYCFVSFGYKEPGEYFSLLDKYYILVEYYRHKESIPREKIGMIIKEIEVRDNLFLESINSTVKKEVGLRKTFLGKGEL